jgi:hypothetical protein
MKKAFLLSTLAAAAIQAHGQFADVDLISAGGKFTIKAGSYDLWGTPGAADFFCNGVTGDYAYRDMWAYRIQGDTDEHFVRSQSTSYGGTPFSTFTASMLKGQNGSDTNPMVKLDVEYRIGATSPTSPYIERCLKVTNLTNQNLDFEIFLYLDYDIPNGAGNDILSPNTYNGTSDLVWQSDTANPGNWAESYMAGIGGPFTFRHDLFYESMFGNGVVDDLNNNFFGGVGDLAVGWELRATLAPGQQSVCPGNYTVLNGTVPEPGTWAALGLGSGWLLRRRRRTHP